MVEALTQFVGKRTSGAIMSARAGAGQPSEIEGEISVCSTPPAGVRWRSSLELVLRRLFPIRSPPCALLNGFAELESLCSPATPSEESIPSFFMF